MYVVPYKAFLVFIVRICVYSANSFKRKKIDNKIVYVTPANDSNNVGFIGASGFACGARAPVEAAAA